MAYFRKFLDLVEINFFAYFVRGIKWRSKKLFERLFNKLSKIEQGPRQKRKK